ncbi:response regulator [Paracraurococcus ruber]|uniref:Two-component system response regulator n=1 Tax=Paracraurococcus ruber TaxID=77675 RepID=A0ABS1CQC1_9PROT|nr:response regulator [Paracraurococcus ruber]MBK1656620.1 two-component system response regulator [Paracraurococcus ruber]TDG33756.1 response regulator [Paracraurococcus ruber]
MPQCLVVDDSAVMRRIARSMLEKLGFDCTEAADGAQAVEAVRQHAPDVILLDWEMPVLDGFGALTALRAEPWGRAPRIVMCTTLSDMERIVAALEAGADEYVMKPYDQEILADKLRAVGVLD